MKSKKIISILAAFAVAASAAVSAYAYTDYNTDATKTLSELKIILGYEDGSFRPDNKITRAEMAAISVRAEYPFYAADGEIEKTIDGDTVTFKDITPSDWFYNQVKEGTILGIFNGYDQDTFGPNDTVTAAQLVKVCLTIPCYNFLVESSEPWYESWMDAAVKYGLIKEGEFTANQEVTRADVAELMYRALNMPMVRVVQGGHDYPPPHKISTADDTPYQRLLGKNIKEWVH